MGDEQSLSTISRQELEQQPQRKYDVAETSNRLAPIAAGLTLLISAVGYMRSLLWGSQIDAAAAAEPSTELDDVTPGRLGRHQESWPDQADPPLAPQNGASELSPSLIAHARAGLDDTIGSSGEPYQLPRGTACATSPHVDLMLPGASNDNTFFVPNSRDGASRGPTGASPGDTGLTTLAKSHGTSQPPPTDTAGETGADTSDDTESGNTSGTGGETTNSPTGSRRNNSVPSLSGPVTLGSIDMNHAVLIALTSLLAGASDPDGDHLSVTALAASTGEIADNSDGTFTFTPVHGDDGSVSFDYLVSDGIDSVHQTALLDLLPLAEQDPVINGSESDDHLIGTSHPDVIVSLGGDDVIEAGGGDDLIQAGAGNDIIYGGDGDDVIFGGNGNDVIFAEAGNDIIFAGSGDDVVFGGDGADKAYGEDGNDVIHGGTGDDYAVGGAGSDVVSGDDGNDAIVATVNDGNDLYNGGSGTDTYDLSATSSGAAVDLAAGTSTSSETGHDQVIDIENVIGSRGNDVISADNKQNTFTGSGGNDRYKFATPEAAGATPETADKITDFTIGDTIDVSAIDADHESSEHQNFLFGGEENAITIVQRGLVTFKFEPGSDGEEATIVHGAIVDGDDFYINLQGHRVLTSADFHGVS